MISITKLWTLDELDARVQQGSHKSCDKCLEFLREELLEFTQKGFWLVLPYKDILNLMEVGELIGLRVSPKGIVPQRDRRPRLIVDLSFYNINQETLNMAPKEAMQYGRALERVLYQIRHANPRCGPVHLAKVDLADGFYRVGLNDSAVPKLAVALPRFPNEEQLLALPLVLPMGWIESPPWFCAATETVADLANNWPANVLPGPHPLEEAAQMPPVEEPPTCGPSIGPSTIPEAEPPACGPALGPSTAAQQLPDQEQAPLEPTSVGATTAKHPASRAPPVPPPVSPLDSPPVLRPFTKPVRHTDIFLDDYVLCVQGNAKARLHHLRRLLHSIDMVFCPVDSEDPATRKHVPSLKKLLKGDAYLSTRKVVLVWLLDTVRQTLELPPHRIERLQCLFDQLRNKTRVPTKLWHRTLGELRSMSIGIPGSRGLFCMLQEGLRHADKYRIRITSSMRDMLSDFEHLTHTLSDRPKAIYELVADHPIAVGPHDAAGTGMGGVWLPTTTESNLPPIFWRARFPQFIQDRLVSTSNPHGDITNSYLELAGLVAHQDVLCQQVNCQGRTLLPLGDNIPAVVWHHKYSRTTTGPAAYLLRLNSIHQRHYRYVAKADYIPGPANQMADDCSRLWQLTNSQLLAHFNSVYPQAQPWQLVELRPVMLSSLISALQQQRPELDFLLSPPPLRTPTGPGGKPSPALSESTPTSPKSPRIYTSIFSKFLPQEYVGDALLPAASLSKLGVYRTTYGPLPRRSNWGPRFTANHAMDRQLLNMQRCYKKEDPPPHKVKPIPVQLLLNCCTSLQSTPLGRSMADLLIIAFFYLLRPGEYTYDSKNNHPFRLCDVTYSTPSGFLNAATAPPSQLNRATSSVLNFITQKNLVKDQPVVQGDTPHPLLSPLKATRRRVQHLRQHNAPDTTPLCINRMDPPPE